MKKFDAIVVGAGPSGITSALLLAEKGLDVVVIERGEKVGVKNMFGGVVAGDWFPNLIEDFWDLSVIERPITIKKFSFLDNDMKVSLKVEKKDTDTPYGFTAYRPIFDAWYARYAQGKGVNIITGLTVKNVIVDNKCVVGVETDNEDCSMYSNVVLMADGVNSVVHRNGISNKKWSGKDLSLGIKEVFRVDKSIFKQLGIHSDKEGLSHEFIGLNKNIIGGGFLYTYSDTISIGVVANVNSLLEKNVSIYNLLDSFKSNVYINNIIKDGLSLEYSAHLLPDNYYSKDAFLFASGLIVVGDAAGFLLNTGIHLEGVNYAIASGVAAAKSVIECNNKKDFREESLSCYIKYLAELNVIHDFNVNKYARKLVKNKDFHYTYPSAICNYFDHEFHSSTSKKKEKFMNEILGHMKDRSKYELLKELYNMMRSYIW